LQICRRIANKTEKLLITADNRHAVFGVTSRLNYKTVRVLEKVIPLLTFNSNSMMAETRNYKQFACIEVPIALGRRKKDGNF